MSSDPVVQLPVDYTGTAPSNRISGEQHILNRVDSRDHRVIIPKLAPFYNNQTQSNERLKVRFFNPTNSQTRDLVEGKDYYPVYYFIQASKATMRPLYGGIEILDDTLEGVIIIDFYQSLGGIWTLTPVAIAEILANLKYNPRIKAWDQIANLPERFPVVDHEWDLVDMVGASDMVAAIFSIRDVLLSSTESGLRAHVDRRDNPHVVTKLQVDLGKVANYPPATSTQAKAGLLDNVYMTALRTREAIEEQAVKLLQAHISERNPHQTRPGDIGAPTLAEHNTKLDKTATAVNSNRFAGFDFPEAAVEILKGTAFNSDRLGGLTLNEIRNEVSQGSIDNAQKLQGKTLDEILGMVPQYVEDNYTTVAHALDSDKLEGKTLDDILELSARQTSDDTLKFGGMTPIEYADQIYRDLGNNLSSTTTPDMNNQGFVSMQRMFFNDNRYFPIYRFNLDELEQYSFPPGYKGEVTHTFIVTPMAYNKTPAAAYAISIVTEVDLTIQPGDPNEADALKISRATISPVFTTSDASAGALQLRVYRREIGERVAEILFDRLAIQGSNEVMLSSIGITNISALSKFIARSDVFNNESLPSINPTHYTLIEQAQAPTSGAHTGTLAVGASVTLNGVTWDNVVDTMIEDPEANDGSYVSGITTLSVARFADKTVVKNEYSSPLKYRILVR